MAALLASAALLALGAVLAMPVGAAEDYEGRQFFGGVNDWPIVNHSQFWELTAEGQTTVEICGEHVVLCRSDFTNREISRLGWELRAE